MPQINFEKRVVAENVEVVNGFPEASPPDRTSSVAAYPIGSKDSDIEEMLNMVVANRRSEIKVPKEFGNIKAVVTSYWLGNRADFNGDGKKDFLLLRTIGLPGFDGKDSTAAWLVAVLDDGDGKASPDEEKAGIVISGGLMAGGAVPITDIEIKDENGDDLSDVLWTKGGKRYLATPASAATAQNADDDNELIRSAMAYYDTAVQMVEAAYVKNFIRNEYGAA